MAIGEGNVISQAAIGGTRGDGDIMQELGSQNDAGGFEAEMKVIAIAVEGDAAADGIGAS